MLDSFITKYQGKGGVGTNSVNSGECVGLVMKYITELGFPWFPGNAKDLFDNASGQHFEKIRNDTTNASQIPKAGDILVFNDVWGNKLGHTGIVVEATPTSFKLFEQNNPYGSVCRVQSHPSSHYDTVVGWLRPKKEVEDMSKITNVHEERHLKAVVLHREVKDSELGAEVGKSLKQALDGISTSDEWHRQDHILKDGYPASEKALKDEKDARAYAEANVQTLKAEIEQLKTQNSPQNKAVRTGVQVAAAMPAAALLGHALEIITNWVMPILQLPEVQGLFTNGLSWGALTGALAVAFAWIQNKLNEKK